MKSINLLLSQVIEKYKGKYIDFYKTYNYSTQSYLYDVRAAYKTRKENTTLITQEWLGDND
jgi:hypothetical protein